MNAAEWDRVDARIGQPHAIERAAGAMPPRLAWLARALEAIDDGRRDRIRAVARGAEAAGHPDVAAVLDLVLADPATVRPTDVRAAANRAGLHRHSEVAFLDLLRCLAVYRTGKTAPPSAALRQASQTRPFLSAATDTLTSKRRPIARYDTLNGILPRGVQILAITQAKRRARRIDASLLVAWFGKVRVDLDPARWPDLVPQPERAAIVARMAQCEPWPAGHDGPARWLYSRPQSEQRIWLGPLLRYIGAAVATGRAGVVSGAVHVALHLANAHRDLGDLAIQLASLEARLAFFQENRAAMAALLWGVRATLEPAHALTVARWLVDDPTEHTEGMVREALGALLANPSTTGDEVRDLLVGCDLPLRTLERLIAPWGPAPARQLLVKALHACENDDDATALSAVPRLIEAGDVSGACTVTLACPPTKVPQRILSAAAAALAAGPDPAAGRLRALAALTPALDDKSGVAAAARRWVSSVGPSPDARGALIAVASSAGASDAAATLMQEEGRSLRTLPEPEADQRAFRVLASALADPNTTVSDPVHEVLGPLDRFVLRRGEAAALKAIAQVPSPAGLDPGLVAWFLRHRATLAPLPGWRQWVTPKVLTAPQVPTAVRGMFDQTADHAVTTALATHPRSAEAFVAAVDEVMDHLVQEFHRMAQAIGSAPFDDLEIFDDGPFDDATFDDDFKEDPAYKPPKPGGRRG